ncbi:MAG: integrase [Burkholderiales bacterium RIFCSPLOWO2_12_FULL_67_210]|nr:MAG: integrase [Burkholderiales bacterium RIFCSPLOWO2_12_FULL_67_210]
MPVPPELRAQILRYYHVEQWRTGTIARQLKVHHGTVERALRQAGLPRIGAVRASRIDAYLPFILETLKKFPNLRASRLYAMVKERGYQGGADHFRHLISHHRPRPLPEAYLRLVTLIGEQGQIDWGHFGHLQIGKAKRPLMAFVAVLSWSRRIFLRFSLDARMESFLRGHVQAFESWGGLPRVLLYDNLKSAVLERQGDAIRFSPTLLAFAAHYHFEPRPVAVARGNEKGRVERAIRYIRDNFWPARTFTDLDDLNAQADAWVNGVADARPCPQDRALTVGQAFAQEVPRLLALPANPYPVEERVVVNVGKTPYVRFDLNDYSVPHTHVRKALTVLADSKTVRILDAQTLVASHARSYDKGQQIETESHITDLVERKAQAHAQRGMGRLGQAVPASVELLAQAGAKGENLGSITSALLRLVDRYGATQVQTAVLAALTRQVPHPHAVRLALEAQREARQVPPAVAVQLSEKTRLRDTVIHAHPLASYDQLSSTAPDPQPETQIPRSDSDESKK